MNNDVRSCPNCGKRGNVYNVRYSPKLDAVFRDRLCECGCNWRSVEIDIELYKDLLETVDRAEQIIRGRK